MLLFFSEISDLSASFSESSLFAFSFLFFVFILLFASFPWDSCLSSLNFENGKISTQEV